MKVLLFLFIQLSYNFIHSRLSKMFLVLIKRNCKKLLKNKFNIIFLIFNDHCFVLYTVPHYNSGNPLFWQQPVREESRTKSSDKVIFQNICYWDMIFWKSLYVCSYKIWKQIHFLPRNKYAFQIVQRIFWLVGDQMQHHSTLVWSSFSIHLHL